MIGRKYGEPSTPDHSHWAALLRECTSLPHAKKLHASIIDHGLQSNTFLANLLIQLYGRCGSTSDASAVFASISGRRNIYSWNIMFTVYAQEGHLQQARSLFDAMPDRNVVSWNAMIACYAQRGHVDQAELLFESMPQRSLASWNSMIAAYSQNDRPEEALAVFTAMDLEGIVPDKITFVTAVNACSSLRSLYHGKVARLKIYESGLESDVSVGNVLITMYGLCGLIQEARDCFAKIENPNVVSWTALLTANTLTGHLREARLLFDQMPVKNEVSWTAMITAHTQSGHARDAIHLFRRMDLEGVHPDEVTVVSAIDACAHQGDLVTGSAIHDEVRGGEIVQDAAVGNSLVNLYGKCGHPDRALEVFQSMGSRTNVVSWTAIVAVLAQNKRLDQAKDFFDRMPIRNSVSWNAIITGYLDDDRPREAIDLYRRMRQEGVAADRVSFVAALDAAAAIADLALGKTIHGHAREEGIEGDILVSTALLGMYGRCGSTEWADQTYSRGMPPRHQDVVLWSALIAAFSQCGNGGKALEVFDNMLLHGVPPNAVTFVSVLAACSHVGAVDKGWDLLAAMAADFDIQPTDEHCACVVDLLGRSGRLAEAEEFLLDHDEENSGAAAGGMGWKALLGSCQGDPYRASRVADLVLQMDPVESSSHVAISNILGAAATPALANPNR